MGLLRANELRNSEYRRTTFGFGKKYDFTDSPSKDNPGPMYDQHEVNSLSYISKLKNSPSLKGFNSPHSKYDQIIYKGQEKHYYGRNGKGPGAYLKQDMVMTSNYKSSPRAIIPKSDRGLLNERYLPKEAQLHTRV